MNFDDYEEYMLSKTKETQESSFCGHGEHKQAPVSDKVRLKNWIVNGGCVLGIWAIFKLYSSGVEFNGFTAVITLICILRLVYSLLTSIKW